MVLTDNQEETDRYWNAITHNGGEESMCGWCKDKWGFSWQITPRVLLEATDQSRQGRGQARVRGDDDDEEDRHRQDRGGARGRDRRCVSSPARSSLARRRDAGAGRPGRGPDQRFPLRRMVVPFWDESLGAVRASVIKADYDLLLGKRTYDIFAAYWPTTRTIRSERNSSASTNMC